MEWRTGEERMVLKRRKRETRQGNVRSIVLASRENTEGTIKLSQEGLAIDSLASMVAGARYLASVSKSMSMSMSVSDIVRRSTTRSIAKE